MENIYFAGMCLAFVLSLAQLCKPSQTISNKLLAAIYFCFACSLFNVYAMHTGLSREFPLYAVINPITGMLGLLLSDFIKSLYKDFQWNKNTYLLCFIILMLLHSPILYAYVDQEGWQNSFNLDLESSTTRFNYISTMTVLVQLIIFGMVALSLKSLSTDWPDNKGNYPKRKKLMLTLYLILLDYFFSITFGFVQKNDDLVYVITAMLPFMLTIVFLMEQRVSSFNKFLEEEYQQAIVQRSLIDGLNIKTYAETIKHELLENTLFLDQELTLEKMAQHIGLHRNLISAIINEHWKQNFNQWINSYRLSWAKDLLASDPTLAITSVCYESGFNSKSTFYKAFKDAYGITPSEYRKTR